MSVSRHDHHNIEVKSVCEIDDRALKGELDVYLFIPRSFDIGSWVKTDLDKDVRARLRLAVPTDGETSAVALSRARQSLKAAIATATGDDLTDEDCVLEAARDLCAIMAETLKQWTSTQARSLMLAHTLLATADSCLHELERLHEALQWAGAVMTDLRELVAGPLQSPVLDALDEYLSHLFLQYLGTIRSELDGISEAPPSVEKQLYARRRATLEETLSGLIAREASYREFAGWANTSDTIDSNRESRLVRLSHLKKFFQSQSFIEISRRPVARRITETTAFAGTALAGIMASFFQRLNRPDLVDVTFQSFYMLCFGVCAYVLRDRLKDWAKTIFHEQARKYVPDYEQVLFARDQRIGVVKEWFRIRDRNSLPDDILALRSRTSGSNVELRLPEDVIHYRKIHHLSETQKLRVSRSSPLALHESIRLNLERYLKYMDDPFKDLIELDKTGQLRQRQSHRVYYFYLCIRSTREVREPGTRIWSQTTATKICRIVLDKSGIVRIDQMDTRGQQKREGSKRKFRPPPKPWPRPSAGQPGAFIYSLSE